jgi:hypothetical protein
MSTAGLFGNVTTNYQSKIESVTGNGYVSQILVSVASVVVLYIVLSSVEAMYEYFNRADLYRTNLIENTAPTDTKSMTISQNPNNPNSKLAALSDNERTGPEYSYSFFLYVNPSSFRQEYGLQHIFHKGTPGQFPLLSPGVYLRSDTNCLRVYMNTFKTWNKYVEVDNFPVGKWVHVTVSCKSTHGEVYINGNLAKKLPFEGYQSYQNYSNIYCFSQRHIKLPSTLPSLDANGFEVFGAVKGFISRLTYFSYALSYTEIQSLLEEGPSKKMESADMPIPPYLADSWWTQK